MQNPTASIDTIVPVASINRGNFIATRASPASGSGSRRGARSSRA